MDRQKTYLKLERKVDAQLGELIQYSQSTLPDDVVTRVQNILIQLAADNSEEDFANTIPYDETVFHWLYIVSKHTPAEFFERNRKTMAKVFRRALISLLHCFVNGELARFDRNDAVLATPAHIVAAVQHLVSRNVAKKRRDVPSYVAWLQLPDRVMAANAVHVLWSINLAGSYVWHSAHELDVVAFTQALKCSYDLAGKELQSVCTQNLIRFFERTSFDVYLRMRGLFEQLDMPMGHLLVMSSLTTIVRRFRCFEPMEPMVEHVVHEVLRNEDVDDVYWEVLAVFVDLFACRMPSVQLQSVLLKLCKDVDGLLNSPLKLRVFNVLLSARHVNVPCPAVFAVKVLLPRRRQLKASSAILHELTETKRLCVSALKHRQALLACGTRRSQIPKLEQSSAFQVLKPGLGSLLANAFEQQAQLNEKVEVQNAGVEESDRDGEEKDVVVLDDDDDDAHTETLTSDDDDAHPSKEPSSSDRVQENTGTRPLREPVDGKSAYAPAPADKSKGTRTTFWNKEWNSEEGYEVSDVDEDDDQHELDYLGTRMSRRQAKNITKASFGTADVAEMRLSLKPLEVTQNLEQTGLLTGQVDLFDPATAELEFSKALRECGLDESADLSSCTLPPDHLQKVVELFKTEIRKTRRS